MAYLWHICSEKSRQGFLKISEVEANFKKVKPDENIANRRPLVMGMAVFNE